MTDEFFFVDRPNTRLPGDQKQTEPKQPVIKRSKIDTDVSFLFQQQPEEMYDQLLKTVC